MFGASTDLSLHNLRTVRLVPGGDGNPCDWDAGPGLRPVAASVVVTDEERPDGDHPAAEEAPEETSDDERRRGDRER